jgi:hypothetical protein
MDRKCQISERIRKSLYYVPPSDSICESTPHRQKNKNLDGCEDEEINNSKQTNFSSWRQSCHLFI